MRKRTGWGCSQRFVEHERLLEESQEVARTIAAHPPLAAQMSKRAIQHSLDAEFERQLRYETRAISLARNAKEDVAESGRAFVEKRKPEFRGR
ncbi:MAG: enoyl-CoA hydratase-related protein [Dehalococcoidia bacterium]|nr:enoyl-CoA hydratase-related protein [Dehalococcoidia bacterium]